MTFSARVLSTTWCLAGADAWSGVGGLLIRRRHRRTPLTRPLRPLHPFTTGQRVRRRTAPFGRHRAVAPALRGIPPFPSLVPRTPSVGSTGGPRFAETSTLGQTIRARDKHALRAHSFQSRFVFGSATCFLHDGYPKTMMFTPSRHVNDDRNEWR